MELQGLELVMSNGRPSATLDFPEPAQRSKSRSESRRPPKQQQVVKAPDEPVVDGDPYSLYL